ncbi:MAG: hypothetical protein AAB295_01540, partial [Chloroflexota bacterium]
MAALRRPVPRTQRTWLDAILAVADLLRRAEHLIAGRRGTTQAGRIRTLETQVDQLRAENELLRARLRRIPPERRSAYRAWERMRILWHMARHALSVRETARRFVVARESLLRWLGDVRSRACTLVRAATPVRRAREAAAELVRILRWEHRRWGTRRIAQILLRLGLRVSRSSVQRTLRRGPIGPRASPPTAHTRRRGKPRMPRGIHALRPHHVWFLDVTLVRGLLGLVEFRVAAVVDAFSRTVVAIGVAEREPTAAWITLGAAYAPLLLVAVHYLRREEALVEVMRPVAGDITRGVIVA